MTTGIIADQTAIGSGLATAISRLKDSKTKSKVIILLTDGANNTGNISPKMAADLAKTFGISIYTIGVGSGAGEGALSHTDPARYGRAQYACRS